MLNIYSKHIRSHFGSSRGASAAPGLGKQCNTGPSKPTVMYCLPLRFPICLAHGDGAAWSATRAARSTTSSSVAATTFGGSTLGLYQGLWILNLDGTLRPAWGPWWLPVQAQFLHHHLALRRHLWRSRIRGRFWRRPRACISSSSTRSRNWHHYRGLN